MSESLLTLIFITFSCIFFEQFVQIRNIPLGTYTDLGEAKAVKAIVEAEVMHSLTLGGPRMRRMTFLIILICVDYSSTLVLNITWMN
jgi:hypothetical protein